MLLAPTTAFLIRKSITVMNDKGDRIHLSYPGHCANAASCTVGGFHSTGGDVEHGLEEVDVFTWCTA